MDSMSHLPLCPCISSESTRQTVVEVRRCSLNWVLQNFTFYPQNVGESLDSPHFQSSFDSHQIKWCLTFYPLGESILFKDNVSLYLNLVSSTGSEDVKAHFKVSLQNSSGTEIVNKTGENIFSESIMWGWNELIGRDTLINGILEPDDTLIIYCEVKTAGRVLNLPNQDGKVQITELDFTLSDDLTTLLDDPKYSDFVFNINGDEIHAHKAILAARSPVFAAMIGNAMKENAQNQVQISDSDCGTIRRMLAFMYTGKVEMSELNVEETISLFELADKYDIKVLMTHCENHLCSLVSGPSAEIPRILSMAEDHHAAKLKESCYEQIKADPEETLCSYIWDQVALKNPLLILNVLRSLAVPNKSSHLVAKSRLSTS